MKTFSILLRDHSNIQIVGIEEFEKLVGIRYQPTLSYEKEIRHLCPYILRLPVIASENWSLGEKYASFLDQGFFAAISIRWIGASIGYGLFAEDDMPADTYIGEYTGQLRQLSRTHPDHNAYCVHYPTRFWSMRYFVIDALKVGNEGRFVNHSDRPNLIVKCLIKDNILHFVFFTCAPVRMGEELTVDYGHDYWINRQKLIIP